MQYANGGQAQQNLGKRSYSKQFSESPAPVQHLGFQSAPTESPPKSNPTTTKRHKGNNDGDSDSESDDADLFNDPTPAPVKKQPVIGKEEKKVETEIKSESSDAGLFPEEKNNGDIVVNNQINKNTSQERPVHATEVPIVATIPNNDEVPISSDTSDSGDEEGDDKNKDWLLGEYVKVNRTRN